MTTISRPAGRPPKATALPGITSKLQKALLVEVLVFLPVRRRRGADRLRGRPDLEDARRRRPRRRRRADPAQLPGLGGHRHDRQLGDPGPDAAAGQRRDQGTQQ